jgi:hypothetical protein
MNSQVFQAALAATARVACCAALVSCQKPTKAPETPSPVMEHATQQEEKPMEQKREVSREPEPLVPSDAFQSCNPKIEQFLQTEPTSDQQTPEDVLACCTLQGNEVDEKQGLAWENRAECCHFLNWQGPFACTPWGPPTPPVMQA